VRSIVRRHPGRAIDLNMKALAHCLALDPSYVRKCSMELRTRAWSFQEYGIILFIRYKRHRRSRCGHPQIYAIGRHYAHTIAHQGTPRVRWHLRKKAVQYWDAYVSNLRNLAFAKIFKGKRPADGTDKGLSPHTKTEKYRRQKANRPRWRGFLRLAAYLAADHAKLDPASGINVQGWAARRLSEGHDYARVLECLAHAVATFQRHVDSDTGWLPLDHRSWIQGVAGHRLAMDGLTTFIRWRERGRQKKRHGAVAPTFKEEKVDVLRLAEWDRGREHLRERKTLPDGSEIEYDPKIGHWIDIK
jgi:hypothetical protein